MQDVAVVGGGPSGAFCAYNLAKNGRHVSVFDHSHPREKPCGGMLSSDTLNYFPFLSELAITQSVLREAHYTSPSGIGLKISMRKVPFRAFSRLSLDRSLIDMASAEGADWVKEKVVGLEEKEDYWTIATTGGQYDARLVVGADGQYSLVRKKIIGQMDRKDYGFTFGYILQKTEDEVLKIQFLSHRRGYIWIIPRGDHTSAGVCCTEVGLAKGIRGDLEAFLDSNYPGFKRLSMWASLIPNVKNAKAFQKPLSGKNWAIIGDAAGHVDPITGEGILYALLDGDLAATAIMENNLPAYDKYWREVFGSRISVNMRARKIIYSRLGLEGYCALRNIGGRLVSK